MNAVMQPFSMAGKCVLITGASSAMGAHFARLLSRAGARLAIAAQRGEQLQTLAADIYWEGGEVLLLTLDLSLPASIERALDSLEARFGGVDVLINNTVGTPAEHSPTDPDSALESVWPIAHCVSQRMLEAGGTGCIITVLPPPAAQAASPSQPTLDLAQLSRNMAEKLACQPIRVNAIAPQPFGVGDPGDCWAHHLADLNGPLLLLASDAGASITGAVLPVAASRLGGTG